MAYISQEQKKVIAEKLKKIVPKNWKYSLGIRHHSTIYITISQGPQSLDENNEGYTQLNPYHLERETSDKSTLEILEKIKDVLNTDNFDHSDIQTDYFCVGHYISINIGHWNKPFVVVD